jgi:mRNA interferase MazF
MVKLNYIPERGDIILINFNPQKGKEQAGYRPAFIVSPLAYNKMASLALMCPITSAIKGLSFEVILTDEMQTKGVILVDHLKSLDWKARRVKFVEKAPMSVVNEVLAKLETLVS